MITPQFLTKIVENSDSFGTFSFEPLAQSFGESMGNALRRTLLSSLEGTAVVAVKIEGVSHLFSTLKGVKETALEITLNLKQVKFKKGAEGAHTLTLNKKGIGKVLAKDLEGDLEVVNGDLYICEITNEKGKVELEVMAESGVGYILAEEQPEREFGFISIDSAYSPVKKVVYKVEEARVGRKSNSDRLIIQIWTDGSITPEESLKQAAELLSKQLAHVFVQNDVQKTLSESAVQETINAEAQDKKFKDLIIDELNLPSRVVNALLRENIETVADLIKIGEEKLVSYKGLGRKSIDLIKDELKKLGFEWNNMKHRIAKRKFGFGYDANKMLLRQLCRNFFIEQTLTTTKQKAKAAQIAVEKLVSKSKVKNEANKNYILKFFGEQALVDRLFDTVGPALVKIEGGYTRLTLNSQRQSDGAMMARLSWAHPVVAEKKKSEKKAEKTVEKTEEPKLVEEKK